MDERMEEEDGYPSLENVERVSEFWEVRARCQGDSGAKGRKSRRTRGKKNYKEKGIL